MIKVSTAPLYSNKSFYDIAIMTGCIHIDVALSSVEATSAAIKRDNIIMISSEELNLNLLLVGLYEDIVQERKELYASGEVE